MCSHGKFACIRDHPKKSTVLIIAEAMDVLRKLIIDHLSSVNVVDGFHNNGRLVSHHSNLVKMRIDHIPRQTKGPKKTNKQKTKDRNEKKQRQKS